MCSLFRAYMHFLQGTGLHQPKAATDCLPGYATFFCTKSSSFAARTLNIQELFTQRPTINLPKPTGRQKSPQGRHVCCRSIRAMCRRARAMCPLIFRSGAWLETPHLIYKVETECEEALKSKSSTDASLLVPQIRCEVRGSSNLPQLSTNLE